MKWNLTTVVDGLLIFVFCGGLIAAAVFWFKDTP